MSADNRDIARIWALTDGRAGNAAQARGLAGAIGRRCGAEVTEKHAVLAGWAAAIPPALSWQIAGWAGWPEAGLAEGRAALAPPWPDLVIGAGRRVAPLVAMLRRRHGMRAVQILNPQMPTRAFDWVVAPHHDGLAGDNVLGSLGAMNALTAGMLADAAAPLAARVAHLPAPRVAVMVGGGSGSATFAEPDAQALLSALEALSRTHGLMITTSRRTPATLAQSLTDRLEARALVWTGGADNPYPGLLGLADAALVTEDSVNMASEAATAGLPVHIFSLSRVGSKIAAFHRALSEHGASRPFTGAIGTWTCPPLAEADRIAAELVQRLGR